MTEPWRCPTCKQLWDEGEMVDGLCPGCLIGDCLEQQRQRSGYDWEKRWDPPSVEELQPLFADYEIQALVGRGGMGAVYRAIQKRLKRQVAIKILPPALGWNPALRDRFVREALTLAKLNHPGFVTIYDSGQSQDLSYLVMEYVDGDTLADYVASNTVSPRQILELGARLCQIMEVAHAAGIIHRDLKPENILVSSLTEVKIADFGVAKLFGEQHADDKSAIFASCKAAGTRSFMAPEQLAKSGQVDLRVDVYSLGVLLYLLLTGGLPEADPVPPPSQVLPGLGSHMDALVLRALAKDPASRHQNMQELRREIEAVLAAERRKETPPDADNASPGNWGQTSKIENEAAVLAGERRKAASSATGKVWKIAAAVAVLFTLMGFAFWKGPWEQRSFGLAPGRMPAFTQPFVTALDNTTRLEMQPIPAGEFEMGSPPEETPERHPSEQRRHVRISKPFWMGKYEVTQGQYQALLGVNPAFFKGAGLDAPVEWVSWGEAEHFCEALTGWEQKAGRIPPGYLYRLPTEAEWEYAACQGGKPVVVTGEEKLNAVAWNGFNSGKKTQRVGQKPANGWGLHDLFGNVSEWCLDSWSETPGDLTEPVDPAWRPGTDARAKVHRGGDSTASFFRSAYRGRTGSSIQHSRIGFRVVLAPAIKVNRPAASVFALPALVRLPPEPGTGYSLPLAQGTQLEMLPLAAGEFFMGTPAEKSGDNAEPGHRVKLTSPFWMGRTEVTQGQYDAVMGCNPSIFRETGLEAPVENVSWYGAVAFCKQLTTLEKSAGRLPEGLVYRLPTRAEWQYACRAGGKTPLFLDKRDDMNEVGWNYFNSQNQTHPVGKKLPNAWGFHDMFGNVSEWCLDCSGENSDPAILAIDPLWTVNKDTIRATSGANYRSQMFGCASIAGRGAQARNESTGFRIVLAPPRDPVDILPAEDAETVKILATLSPDALGFRKLPPEWWPRCSTHPEGLKASSQGNLLQFCMKRFVDASQKTAFTLNWKIGGLPGPAVTQDDVLDVVFALESLDGPPAIQGRMSLAKPHGDLVVVKPDTWYRSSLEITHGGAGKTVLSLFARETSGEVLLKQWEAPASEIITANLKHARLRLQVNGDKRTLDGGYILCSEAWIRQGEPPGTKP
jgi:formylglycine-generating enzyme required for sulfatase activity